MTVELVKRTRMPGTPIEGQRPADVAASFGVTRDVIDHIRSRMNARLRKIVARLEVPETP